jgi:hypothetical protein
MSLFEILLCIICNWRATFRKSSTFETAILHAVSTFNIAQRKTITTKIRFLEQDEEDEDHSHHYKIYSRSPWDHNDLFRPIIKGSLNYFEDDYIQVNADYTPLKKSGKHIPDTSLIRDPTSPKYRPNFMLGMTFLHFATSLPLYKNSSYPARSLPIRWHRMPKMKKPFKKAPEEDWEEYKKFQKENNRSKIFVEQMQKLRQEYNDLECRKKIIAALDGDFCNRTVLTSNIEGVEYVVRARKNIKLCFKHEGGGRRFYSAEKFTPEQIRQNEDIPWKSCTIYHGGEEREVYYKEIRKVLWQGGTRRKELRLIVLRSIPYRKTKKGKILYRQPAYLLCTDLELDIEKAIQIYFDRWEIEVNHKDIKHYLGIGQAQVRNKKGVEREPGHSVAAYSALLLAGIQFTEKRIGEDLSEKTSWYKNKRRSSIRDLSRRIREEIKIIEKESSMKLPEFIHALIAA